MPQINPFVGLFVAIAALNAGMFMWLHADIAVIREDVIDNSERLARIEATVEATRATQEEHGERLARIEGTVAGALGRPFPERMARAPEAEAPPEG